MQILVLLLVFVGTSLLLIGGYAFVNRRRLSAAADLRARLANGGALALGESTSILRDERASGLGFLNAILEGKSFTAYMARELTRAGSKTKVGEFVLICAVSSVVAFFIGQKFIAPLFAIPMAAVGLVLPYLNLKRQQSSRNMKFELQLPDAIDMLVNALKAGYSLHAAMDFVGKETVEPLGPEFSRFYDEQRLGIDARTALLNMQDRVGTDDLKMFVTSLLIQRETGGNLGEVLSNLSNLMRERVAFRGHVKTLTAESKMSANVLTALPVGLFFFMLSSNREYMDLLLTTERGNLMLAYACISVIFGYMVMMKIASIEM